MFDPSASVPHTAAGAFFAGIAPGLESTALVLLDPTHDAPLAIYAVSSGRANRTGLARYAGFNRMVSGTLRHIRRHGAPALLAVRGYSLGGPPRMHCELIELGALLRGEILRRRWPLTEAPPGTLHKFAGAAGDPNPQLMAAALAQIYRRSFGSAREAEAYALAHVARALVYPDAYNPERVAALVAVARTLALQGRARQGRRAKPCRAG